MCGFAGKIWLEAGRPADVETVNRMGEMIAHRGPDDSQTLSEGEAAFAFRRLAIIDIEGGQQPLQNEDGRYTLVFNGEIYNYRGLMNDLQERGHRFSTRCDAEVVVHLYEERGVECLQELEGMFAFAIWDRNERTIFMARDRAGEKSLYWSQLDGCLVFGSEMKALLHEPTLTRRLDERALAEYLAYQYVPPPRTIFENINKLEPATWMRIDIGRGKSVPKIHSGRYWSPRYEPKKPVGKEEAKREVIEQIDRAIKSRLESEAPLGILLSGGIDSSTITALARRHIRGPLRTFSVGFKEASHNELPFARQIAEQYSTLHEEIILDPTCLEALPQIVWHADEPFGDASAVPTYFLSQLARQHVTVALGGEGGDENFAGYNRYKERRKPRGMARTREQLRMRANRLLHPMIQLASQKGNGANFPWLNALSLTEADRQYCDWMGVFDPDLIEKLWAGDREALSPSVYRWMETTLVESGALHSADRRMASDLRAYLPGDLMQKVDRMSMAHALEVRAPFLSRELMEYAAQLPTRTKMLNRKVKGLLREASKPLLPEGFAQRKKKGFTLPLNSWLRKELSHLPEAILLSPQARARGLFDMKAIESLLEEFKHRQFNHGRRVWALIMFELWAESFLDPIYPPDRAMASLDFRLN